MRVVSEGLLFVGRQRHSELLMITLSIGGDEIAHFLEWVDFAGNGVRPSLLCKIPPMG